MTRRKIDSFLIFICIVVPGCDPMVGVSKRFTLNITEAISGAAASGAIVDCASTRIPLSYEKYSLTPKQWIEGHGWKPARADSEGRVEHLARYAVITKGRHIDYNHVKGREFFVQVSHGAETEIVTLVMEPGNSVVGEKFRVEVLSVQEPVWRKRKWHVEEK